MCISPYNSDFTQGLHTKVFVYFSNGVRAEINGNMRLKHLFFFHSFTKNLDVFWAKLTNIVRAARNAGLWRAAVVVFIIKL